MMKKWGFGLFFSCVLIGSVNCLAQVDIDATCCSYDDMNSVPRCCESDNINMPGVVYFEYREHSQTKEKECCDLGGTPYGALNDYGKSVGITELCCETATKGESPGNYEFVQPTADTKECCIIGTPRRWNQKEGEGTDSSCCKHMGGEWAGYSCCKKDEPIDIEQNKVTQNCCREEVGKWTAFENQGYCCGNGTGKTWDGQVEKACCMAFVGDGFTWKNGTCCSSEYKNLSGGSDELCCPGVTFKKSYDETRDKHTLACCPQPGAVYPAYSGNFTYDLEMCCKSGGPMYIASYAADVLRFSHSCCNSGENVYNTGVTVNHGGLISLQACCKGTVYNKVSSDHQDCCEEGGRVYKNGNSSLEACCSKDKFVVKRGDLEACCYAEDEIPYNRKIKLPDGNITYATTCCKGKNWAETDCCESESSAKNVDGNISEACCANAGGTFISTNSFGGGSDVADTAFCCKGSVDLVSGERTKECCENASGKWTGTFCCGTWGKKVDGACKADSLPDSGSGDPG